MTPEEKKLLLQDLCGRIMYGVKCTVYEDTSVHTLSGVLPNRVYDELYFEELDWKECDGFADIQYCKPYLFPLSSMTEEQKNEYESLCIKETSECTDLYGIIFTKDYYYDTVESIDYLYKNHIDIRGLIPMGLANDATGLNIY